MKKEDTITHMFQLLLALLMAVAFMGIGVGVLCVDQEFTPSALWAVPLVCTGLIMMGICAVCGGQFVVKRRYLRDTHALHCELDERRRAEEAWRFSERALRTVLESFQDGVLIFKRDGRLLHVNDTMCKLYDVERRQALRLGLRDVFPQLDMVDGACEDVWCRVLDGEVIRGESRAQRLGDEAAFDIELVMRKIELGGETCVLATVRDISSRKRAEAEREALVIELQEALSQVKVLRGFLPICANCKKIRDDQGYWNQIESYIREHSEAEFSHSICPECAHELYPELYPLGGQAPEDSNRTACSEESALIDMTLS